MNIKAKGTNDFIFAGKGSIVIIDKKKGVEQHAKWIKEHPEEAKKQCVKYKERYVEKRRQNHQKWKTKNPVAFRQIKSRSETKRKRGLGFEPLNEPFEGCEAHHIDKVQVIYIPVELHRSVYHNVFTGRGMEEINKLAFDFLEGRKHESTTADRHIGKPREEIVWKNKKLEKEEERK